MQEEVIAPDRLVRLAQAVAASLYPGFRHFDYSVSEEDLVSLAVDRLLVTTRRTDSAKWETWARRVAIGAVIDYYRKAAALRWNPQRRPRTVLISSIARLDGRRFSGMSEAEVLDHLSPWHDPSPEEGPDVFDIARLRGIIANLPERERLVLQYTIVDRSTNQVCASRLGLSLRRVKQLRQKALETVRRGLAVEQGHAD